MEKTVAALNEAKPGALIAEKFQRGGRSKQTFIGGRGITNKWRPGAPHWPAFATES